MKQLSGLVEKIERRRKDPVYQKVKKIKRIKVTALKKKLEKALQNKKFRNLQFDKPEMGKFVIIPFTIEDADDKREEYDSETTCRRTIQKAFEKTNWRLMSDGVHYRLGILSGRLKAYEREDDIIELIRREK